MYESNADLDKNIDTLVTKLPVCPPNVFHLPSFEDVYEFKEAVVLLIELLNALNEDVVTALAVKLFNEAVVLLTLALNVF